jgi:RNA-directed DNA polymerase
MLLTPESIRTLQRKLYLKAKGEPGFRFYSLYDKVYRRDILRHAFALVHTHRGGPGIDGQTTEAVRREIGVETFLDGIEEELRQRTYKPQAVKRVLVPKPNGGQRPLGIPTIRDRVVQTAVKLVIEPIFEADFCDHSYGFRPKRSAHDAVDDIAQALHEGYTMVFDADVSKYFDSIPHAKLMATLAERISDGALLHLLKMWLKAPVIEETEDGRRRCLSGKGHKKGTPQGGVISPLLSNLYLHLLDRIWERHRLKEVLGAHLVRYADDFVILCRSGTYRVKEKVQQVLARLDLTLNAEKTRLVNAGRESFTFLGFEFRMRRGRRTSRYYPHVQPSRKSLQRIKDQVTSLTERRLTWLPMEEVVGALNEVLRGWVGYFHYRNCSAALGQVKWHVQERLRTHLRRRHKVRDRKAGYKRFPDHHLYSKYGLYEVPTTAVWRR